MQEEKTLGLHLSQPPLYAKSYHFHMKIFETCKSFPKCYRPSLGAKLEDTALELTVGLRHALFSKGNKGFSRYLLPVDRLKVLLQTSYDLKLISHGRYEELTEAIQEIGRMIKALTRTPHAKSIDCGDHRESFKPHPSDAPLPTRQEEL